MTTKLCPKCQEEIQASANKCKHCSADLRNRFKRHYIISGMLVFIALIIVLSSLGGSNPSSSSSNTINTQKAPVEIVSISSLDLYKEYADNEIKADEAYKDKVLEIEGNVESIGKDIMDSMYVALEGDGVVFTVQCMLKSSEKEKAINLNEGDYVTVQGKNSGKLGNILIRNCIIK